MFIEMGFLTNPEEERLLLADAYQAKRVRGMVSGAEAYFGRSE